MTIYDKMIAAYLFWKHPFYLQWVYDSYRIGIDIALNQNEILQSPEFDRMLILAQSQLKALKHISHLLSA